ncbi:MAG: glycoside hydrolase family 43 protein [Pseudomonadota bacterium]
MQTKIRNPILRGFNPDPSICRVGDDFFIATSTFEWYPGVQIHHSKDLRHWQLLSRPLNEERFLNMLGTPDSCGVWAPCLSFADDKFWLLYTDVKRFDGDFKDTHNFLTTAPAITGPWSDPLYLNSSGFDPSLFHDADGRKWYTNMVWDHRPGCSYFRGIAMQEFLAESGTLVGGPKHIFDGTALDFTEGPHIHRIGGYYYLITAEGGTGYGHAMTVARSTFVGGPYEPDPDGPLVTARDHPDWPLQRCGHGDLVQLDDGSFYVVFLGSRRSRELPDSPLGRETILQPVELTRKKWLRMPWPDPLPRAEIDAPLLPSHPTRNDIEHDDFDDESLDSVYQWLRTPRPKQFYSLTERPGYLRLYGKESPGSLYTQALIARRQTSPSFVAETSIEFSPVSFQQMAGLILYYNSRKFHYLYVSADDEIGKHLAVMSCEAESGLEVRFPLQDRRIALPDVTTICLRFTVQHTSLRLAWAAEGGSWQEIPLELDVRFLTDQAGMDGAEQFTGTFIGVCANDVSGRSAYADFDYLEVRNLQN